MRAGLLRESIIIQRPTNTKDEFGAIVTTWSNHVTTRARVINGTGNATTQNNELWHSYNKTFVIRIYHDVEETDRIMYGGKLYSISSIDKDIDQQQKTITAQLINE